MPIKRRTTIIDEFDDIIDKDSITSHPAQQEEHSSSTTSYENDEGTSIESPKTEEVHGDTKSTRPTVGRTIADLVIEFKSDNRAMSITLTLVSFVIFITKIDSIESFKYPLIAACIFNVVWFGSSGIATIVKNMKKQKPKVS